MVDPLPDDYVAKAMMDARRFQACWDQGTSGVLAAHTARLIRERKTLLEIIEHMQTEAGDVANLEAAWEAHKQRQAATAAACQGKPLERVRYGCSAVVPQDAKPVRADDASPAERLLQKTIDVIRDRRPKYGGPREHFKRTVGMVNAAFADVLTRPLTEADWAIIMTLDKVARYRGPGSTIDGPVDIAGYASCLYEVSGGE